MKKVLIIGGGVAGMAAASALKAGGLDCCIIEKAPQTGGKASTYGCKAAPDCTSCGVCGLFSPELDVSGVEMICKAQVLDAVREDDGSFRVLMGTPEGLSERDFSKVVVATGFEGAAPDRFERVFTGPEMEELLYRRRGEKLFDAAPKSVAFIMCSGSRDKTEGADYCSLVCCEYGPRTALTVKNAYPDCAVKVFYIDLRGKKGEEDLKAAKVEIVRSKAVLSMCGDAPVVSYDGAAGSISEEFDYVFLCTGVRPGTDTQKLADIFDLSINDDGFLSYAEPPEETGVFVAGTAGGPMKISGCIESAKIAASAILEGGAV